MNRTIALLVAALFAVPLHAQQHHAGTGQRPLEVLLTESDGEGLHGGSMQSVSGLMVETVVEPDGIRVFPYDNQGKPLDVGTARGVAVLKVDGDAKRYRYDLFPDVAENGGVESLAVAVDLRRIAGSMMSIELQIVGLPGASHQPLRVETHAAAPMTETQRVAAAIAEQRVCPVSGQPLGSMGEPIAVAVGDGTVFVCCAACVDAVKSDPAKYLTKKPQIQAVTATEADAAAIARQKVCPVMDEPLGSMGTPLKVSGLGRDVFLCCKGCLKFLEREPQKYLAKLPPLPSKPVVMKATVDDERYVSAQKLCPVMDEPLDAMGGPFRTEVQGRVVYVCCPACAKKLHADPEVYLNKLAAQGVDPPAVR